tara:strand:+ start:55 stop:300 length:246 start_codon:yes stop_codon:yes gene_type:complete
MEYLNFVALAIVTCIGFLLGALTAYYYFRSELTSIKNQWADKATIANLLRSQLGKEKDEKTKKKHYRKHNRSKSSGKKLQA